MSQCPSQFAATIKEAGDQFDDILTNEELLNLTDPSAKLDQNALNRATGLLNKKFDDQKNKKGTIYPFSQFKKDYPVLSDRLDLGPLTTTEVAIFATETGAALEGSGNQGQITLDVSDWTPGAQIPAGVDDTLGLMDGFFDENMGASLSSGACAAFAVKVAVIGGLLQAIKSKADSFGDIPGLLLDPFDLPSIDEILEKAKSKLSLEAIKKSLEDVVDKALDSVKKQADSIIAGLDEIEDGVRDAINDINAFTSDKNKNGMMDGIDKMIAGSASAFENIDAKALGMLMFRLCQVAEALQTSSDKPLQKLILTASATDQAKRAAKNYSAKASKDAVEAGATRMDPTEVAEKKEEFIEKQRAVSSNVWDMVEAFKSTFGVEGDGIGLSNETFADDIDEFVIDVNKAYPKVSRASHLPKGLRPELKLLQASFTEPSGPVTFEVGKLQSGKPRDVQKSILHTFDKAGRDIGNPGNGWTRVKTKVWVKVLDMTEQLGHPVVVTKGFHPESKYKPMRKGQAVLIEFEDTIDNAIAYIIAASRAGFKGIFIGRGAILVTDASRFSTIHENIFNEKEAIINNTLPDSDERRAQLNTTSFYILRYLMRLHLHNLFEYKVAVMGNNNGPDKPLTPEEQAKQDQENSDTEKSTAEVEEDPNAPVTVTSFKRGSYTDPGIAFLSDGTTRPATGQEHLEAINRLNDQSGSDTGIATPTSLPTNAGPIKKFMDSSGTFIQAQEWDKLSIAQGGFMRSGYRHMDKSKMSQARIDEILSQLRPRPL